MDAGTLADDAAPTYARLQASLPTDTGPSSWMMPQSTDVSAMPDAFGSFDPWPMFCDMHHQDRP
eukprot:7563960-Pyramimonas_sp.AAC.1